MTKNLTSIIIGAGSIGLRHADALKALGHQVVFVSSRTDLEDATFSSVAEAVAGTTSEYAVVANVTSRHDSVVADLTKAGFQGKVLIEKPAQITHADVSGFSEIAVAFNLRLHPVLLELRKRLAGLTIYAVECYVGQHLSTWRNGRDLSAQYSAHADQGGGVLRDLSHELDYLTWIFGPWVSLAATGGRIADVTVDSDDSWAIIGELQKAKQFSLQMNYLDTKPRRELRITTSAGTIRADLIGMVLEDELETLELSGKTADTYGAMHKSFLYGKVEDLAGLDEGNAVDRLIAVIETSARDKKWMFSK